MYVMYPFVLYLVEYSSEFFDVTEDDFGVSNGADIICVSCSFHKRIEMRFQTKLAWTNMQIMQSRYDSRRSSIPLVKNLSDVFRQTKPYCAADTWESVGKLTIFKLQKNALLCKS